MYDLFDDIIFLSDWLIVYQGPQKNVLEFFESMGFKCLARKGVEDFLQEQYLLLLDLNQMASALFRFITVLGRDLVVASTLSAFTLLIMIISGGFILKLNHHHFVSLTNNIKKWWIWGYWISPLMYTQNAISTNDFLGHSWSEVLNGSSNLVECLLRQNGTGLVSELFQRNKALIKELSIPPLDSF